MVVNIGVALQAILSMYCLLGSFCCAWVVMGWLAVASFSNRSSVRFHSWCAFGKSLARVNGLSGVPVQHWKQDEVIGIVDFDVYVCHWQSSGGTNVMPENQ